MSIDIKLKRVDRVYREGEKLQGAVVITSKTEISHSGIQLAVEGSVNLQLSAKSVGLFEAFYNSLKPVQLLSHILEVVPPGKLPAGTTELAFELQLKPKEGLKLYETYHGVFVNIQYTIKADMPRPLLAKNLTKTIEFIVENEPVGTYETSKVDFSITPESLENGKKQSGRVPNFKITGSMASVVCPITQPFTGELVVEECDAKIKSIELQLVRVETCGCADGFARDATEIQNIQIAEGDVCRGMPIPIYMIFPRLFTCPTLAAKNFKVEFEVNVVVLFNDAHLITENFPIKLLRTKN
jgi:hypothetical protein